MYLSVCVSVCCLSVCSSICSSNDRSTDLYIRRPVYMFIYLPFYLCIYCSDRLCMSTNLSICLFIIQFKYLSNGLFISLLVCLLSCIFTCFLDLLQCLKNMFEQREKKNPQKTTTTTRCDVDVFPFHRDHKCKQTQLIISAFNATTIPRTGVH